MELQRIDGVDATPSASSVASAATLPGTASITLPDHCFQNAETVQTFINAWSHVMVAKEQSRASVVASTCGFLSAKARAKADTECSKVQSAKDVLVTRTTEEGRTTRAKEESETTRECRRLQRDEVIQTLHRSPWQNFTNTCTMLFGFTTLTNLVKNRVVIPSRALRFFVALLLFVLMSRSPAFRRMLTRFMFWRYPRFSRQSDGCSVSLDGRYLCFEKNSDVRILPPTARHEYPPSSQFYR